MNKQFIKDPNFLEPFDSFWMERAADNRERFKIVLIFFIELERSHIGHEIPHRLNVFYFLGNFLRLRAAIEEPPQEVSNSADSLLVDIVKHS